MKKIFVARQYLTSETSLRRVDEEAFFDDFDEAREYLRELEKEDYSQEDLLYFRHEIEEIPINVLDNWPLRKCWKFNLNGDLLQKWPDENHKSNFEVCAFAGGFHKSEIVNIKPNLENNYSCSIEGTFGVVCVVPEDKKSWLSKGNDPDEWDGHYVVNFITPEGILSHSHLPEEAMSKLEGELPTEYAFLEILSEYFDNDGNVEHADIIKEVISQRLYAVKHQSYFDLTNEKQKMS